MRPSVGHAIAVLLFFWDDCVGCGVGERVGGWRRKEVVSTVELLQMRERIFT